mgnify:CR=1 FL=1
MKSVIDSAAIKVKAFENIYFGNVPINVEQVVGDGVRGWPNPATEFIYVDAPENASVEVYSVDGRMITSIPANGTSENSLTRQLSINSLTAGVYVVNITTANGSSGSCERITLPLLSTSVINVPAS